MVSDNWSGLNKNERGNSNIEHKYKKILVYLEGEEKDLVEIKMFSDDPPKTNKAIPSDDTKPNQNKKQIFRRTSSRHQIGMISNF